MKIDQNSPYFRIPQNPPPRPQAIPRPAEAQHAANARDLTPHERLRQLLEEKQLLVQSAFDADAGEPELGKHIDLRV